MVSCELVVGSWFVDDDWWLLIGGLRLVIECWVLGVSFLLNVSCWIVLGFR